MVIPHKQSYYKPFKKAFESENFCMTIYIGKVLDKRSQVNVVYADSHKAFDQVIQ